MMALLTIENLAWGLIVIGGVAVLVLSVLGMRRRSKAQRRLERSTRAEPDSKGGELSETADDAAAPVRIFRASGLSMNPYLFVLVVFVLALLASFAVLNLFDGMMIPAVVTFAAVAYIVANVIVESAHFRALRFEQKLVDAVDLLIGALSSGENPAQAIATVADLSDAPIRGEFTEIVNRLKVGMPIRRALSRLQARYDCEGVRLFVNTLAAKWTAGGDFVPVLGVVNQVIRDRLRYHLRLQSQLSGARVSAILVAISPYILLLAFQWKNPGWIRLLIEHPIGPILLFGAIGLQVFGFVLMRRMIRVTL